MTTVSPQYAHFGAVVRARHAFRRWRRSRPFWGGLFTMLAGLEIFATTQLDLSGLKFQMGPTGFLAWLIPTILIACGLFLWFTPQQRMFYAVVAASTTVFSLIGVNLGGFFIGLLLGMVGSGLGFAWTPIAPPAGAVTDGDTTDPDEAGDGTGDAVAAGDDDGAEADDKQPVAVGESAGGTSHLLTDTLPQPRNPLPEETDPRGKPLLAILLVLAGVTATSAVAVRSTPAYADPCPPMTRPSATTSTGAPAPEPSPSTAPSGSTAETDDDGNLLTDIINGITGLFGGDEAEPSNGPTPSTSPMPTPTTKPTTKPAPGPGNCPPAPGKKPPAGEDGVPAGVKHLKAAADQPRVAKTPSLLTGSKVTMYNMRMDGIVDLPTADGTIRVLQFSMDRAVTTDFRLDSPGPAGIRMGYETGTLTVSGNVKFYATRFVGWFLGIKITLTPESPIPPDGIPLPLPIISFDDPELRLVYVDCNQLTTRPRLDLSVR